MRGKSAANEAALERELVDPRALQQQADHSRRERQAAQERVAHVQANLRDEQARLQVTEELVTAAEAGVDRGAARQGTPPLVAMAMNWKGGYGSRVSTGSQGPMGRDPAPISSGGGGGSSLRGHRAASHRTAGAAVRTCARRGLGRW